MTDVCRVRDAAIYLLPLSSDALILHPEKVVLQFGKWGSVDVGSLCYLQRRTIPGGAKRRVEGRPVNQETLNYGRVKCIRKLISYISDELKLGNRKYNSLRQLLSSFVKFVDWCDAESHQDVLESERAARSAFRGYVLYLRERVARNSLGRNTATRYQSECLQLLSGFLGVDNLHRGVNLLCRSIQATSSISPPDEGSQAKVLSLCEALFSGLSEFAIEKKSYPFALSMPKYLGWGDPVLWIFPTSRWCMPPQDIARRNELKYPHWCFDYTRGCLSTFQEIEKKYPKKNNTAKRTYIAAKKLIEDANSSYFHFRRRQAAFTAQTAFIILFVAMTGMNWQQVRELPWNEQYEVGSTSQGFRAVKYRAGNKLVSFEIQSGFLPSFKRFIELRRYLLNGKEWNCLFVSFGIHGGRTVGEIGESLVRSFYSLLRRIDPEVPRVLPRQWRAAKSDWALRNEDSSVAAMMLQNTEKTILRSYAQGSETVYAEEMTMFFSRLSKIVLNKNQVLPLGGISGPVGGCSQYGNPHSLNDSVSIPVDCRQPEGCFFCDKYVVHADEKDVKKLLSCRYCIQQTSHLSSSDEHFIFLFDPVLKRIDILLKEIGSKSKKNAEMVEIVAKKVEGGDLDPYWSGKLEMLISMGL